MSSNVWPDFDIPAYPAYPLELKDSLTIEVERSYEGEGWEDLTPEKQDLLRRRFYQHRLLKAKRDAFLEERALDLLVEKWTSFDESEKESWRCSARAELDRNTALMIQGGGNVQ